MNVSKIKAHFFNWREWELNPIVIKELRQAVRSWAVIGMLALFLIGLFITSLIFLVTQTFQIEANLQLGGTMFSAFVVILAGASIFFIPLYVGVRVAVERQENNPDLLYVSTLSPGRIIFGKFLCGAYMALLFFSACMPFMAFTNLLRGVDLPTVFFILSYIFLVVCAANQIAIFFACLPASRPFKILMALGGSVVCLWAAVPVVEIAFEFLRSGVGSMMAEHDFWINVLTFIGIVLSVAGLFFVLSVALISPPSANRALPVRIYITVVWVLGGLLSFGWVVRTGEGDRMEAWTYPTFLLMMFALLVIISNADQLSLRVRRTIPKSGLKRALAFLFFNGAAGGLVWVAGVLLATFFIGNTVETMFTKFSTSTPSTPSAPATNWFGTMAAYAFDYGLAALLTHRRLMSRRAPKITGLLAVMLVGGWAIVPSIVEFFLNRLSWNTVEQLQLGNMFNVISLRDADQQIYHLYFAFGWLAVMLVLSAKWFFQQLQNFRPPARVTPENSPPVLQ